MAPADRQTLPRHRSHGHRGVGHRGQPQVLPRPARNARGRRERELWNRAGASEQRIWRPFAHTALRANSGPGIELLEYLAPRDGRPFPTDEHANDIAHRHTILLTSGADAAAHQLQVSKVNFVSSGVVANQNEQLGFRKAFLARDPDGHAIEIEEK